MAISAPDTTLSANDKRILNALFDPETLPSSVASAKEKSAIDASLPAHPTIPSSELSALESRQNDLVRLAASAKPDALEHIQKELDEIINQHGNYPSAYLNRAMVRRLEIEAALESSSASSSSSSKSVYDAPEADVSELFKDLTKAIHLALPEAPATVVSPYQARILRTAHSHRAYLYLKAAETGVSWKGKGKTELEELASSDFAAAARYGDEVAREMSVRTNPYAKMCGAIVRNALAKERDGE
jgi:hypothetical protein